MSGVEQTIGRVADHVSPIRPLWLGLSLLAGSQACMLVWLVAGLVSDAFRPPEGLPLEWSLVVIFYVMYSVAAALLMLTVGLAAALLMISYRVADWPAGVIVGGNLALLPAMLVVMTSPAPPDGVIMPVLMIGAFAFVMGAAGGGTSSALYAWLTRGR
jgi:hypothetical protein